MLETCINFITSPTWDISDIQSFAERPCLHHPGMVVVVIVTARAPRQWWSLGHYPSVSANGHSKHVGFMGGWGVFSLFCDVVAGGDPTAIRQRRRAGLSPATATEPLHLEVKAKCDGSSGATWDLWLSS